MAAYQFALTPSPFRSEGWRALSDEEIIARYRAGWGSPSKDDAADELFRRHQARIVRWCWRFTHDRESAADLAQDIFLRAYRNLDQYRGECRFSTWLYVIARNLCMSAIQRRANEPVWVAKACAAEIPDASEHDVHAVFEMEETRRRNWRFILDTLDHTEARVMLLHYGREMPLSDVSRALGLTNKSGAKAYIVSARRKLEAAIRPRRRSA
jgi:RNA polymerase sigma-70 factor (ECF subfamily)